MFERDYNFDEKQSKQVAPAADEGPSCHNERKARNERVRAAEGAVASSEVLERRFEEWKGAGFRVKPYHYMWQFIAVSHCTVESLLSVCGEPCHTVVNIKKWKCWVYLRSSKIDPKCNQNSSIIFLRHAIFLGEPSPFRKRRSLFSRISSSTKVLLVILPESP